MKESISVIIPAFNNANTIENTVHSLLEQQFDHPLEIIVIDDGSRDETAKILRSTGQKVIQNPTNLGLAASLNRGISLSKNELIVTLHADVTPLSKNWLTQLIAPLVQSDAGASCSLQHPPKCSQSELSLWEKLLWGKLRPCHALNGKADAYKREVFDRVGTFDQERFRTAGEDEDMALRLRLHAVRIAATLAEIRHNHNFGATGRKALLRIIAKEYAFGRCGGALRRKFPKHRPSAYVYPIEKSPLNDGAFRVFLCFGTLVPYLQLFCVPGLIAVSLMSILDTARQTDLRVTLFLYPFFNIARFWCYSLGYLHGLITGTQT